MDTLTILDDIRIATPCHAVWDEMPGDDRVRLCSTCSGSVYNISAMTSIEAAALIEGREGGLCARLYRRADGTVMTADCPPLTQNRRLRRFHALAIILVALLVTYAGRSKGESPPSGPDLGLDDWVHWARVALGLSTDQLSAPACRNSAYAMGAIYRPW